MPVDNSDPRFLLIDGRTGRWTGIALRDGPAATTAGDDVGLRLTADPTGSLRLDCRDGSLGRLVLPRLVAVDPEFRVYVLDPMQGVVRRFDPLAPAGQPFRELPGVGPRTGLMHPEPRRFRSPWGLAVSRDALYVADAGARRVQVFALHGLALRAIWTFAEAARDVAVFGGTAYVLTDHGIYRHRLGDDRPSRFQALPLQEGVTWRRLGIDQQGRLYALRGGTGVPAALDVFLPSGQPELGPDNQPRRVADAAEVRDRFAFPAVWSFPDETPNAPLRFVLPGSLTRACGREPPQPPKGRPPDVLFGRCPPWSDHPCGEPTTAPAGCCQEQGLVFDLHGACVKVRECRPPHATLFRKSGGWLSDALDSRTYRCQWHRVELTLRDLPPGCGVRVRTYTDDQPHLAAEIMGLPDQAWDDGLALAGVARDPKELARDARVCSDFLMMSGPGRYLWLLVELTGDGLGTPVLESLRAHFPRQSYLQYLPAVFSEDEQSRRFLERYLSIFQAEWDVLEQRVNDVAAFFDPKAVPAVGGFLEYLADWLGVTFEHGWSPAQRRRFLKAVPSLTFAPRDGDNPGRNRRGTLDGLRDFLRVTLANLAGGDAAAQLDFPVLVEGFRERDFLLLQEGRRGDAEDGRPLWGAEVVGRFQVDDYARLDEARLLPDDQPELDVFGAHAHRFRVFVPAAWVPDAAAERTLRRAIEAEKPAHTDYTLHLVGACFRVGVQSTVGVDTIIGGLPSVHLVAEGDVSGAPDRPPAGLLGYDTVLAAAGESNAMRLGRGVRLGVEAVRL